MKPSKWPGSDQSDETSNRFTTKRLTAILLLAGGTLLVAGLVAGPVAGTGLPGDTGATQQATLTPAPVQTSGSASGGGSASASDAGGAVSDPVQDAREVAYGDTIRSSIDDDDPQSESYRGYHEPLTFEGSAGDVIGVEMRAGYRGTGGEPYPPRPPRRSDEGRPADPYLFVVGPDGDVIAENDDTENGLNAAVRGIVLPEDGEYTVVAAGFRSEATFDYTLRLQTLDTEGADLRSIDLNSTETGELDKTDPYDEDRRGFYEPVTFDGDAGQTVRIEMGSQPGDTYLQLLDPSGTVVAENDDSDGLNSTIERVTLTEDGEYTIVATSFSREDTFPYEQSVETVGTGTDAGPDLRSIAPGQTRESRIDENDPRAPFLRGHFEPVTFDGQAGEDVTIEMESDDDSYLILYGPNGDVVAENDDHRGLDSRIQTALPEDGEYTIIATSYDREATFDYSLSLSASDGPTA